MFFHQCHPLGSFSYKPERFCFHIPLYFGGTFEVSSAFQLLALGDRMELVLERSGPGLSRAKLGQNFGSTRTSADPETSKALTQFNMAR